MKLAFIAVFLFSIQLVQAEDKSNGCGLGSMVAPKKTLLSTTIANYIDITVPAKTSATTTGTSGCSYHSLVKVNKMQIHYSEGNFDILKLEIASGQGEYLAGLARTLGCQENATEVLNSRLQNDFSEIGMTENGLQLLQTVKKSINADKTLKAACPLAV